MADPQRDPIVAAVEGVCGKYLAGYPGTYGEWNSPCMDCEYPRWRHWLRDAREKLAETERERDKSRQEHENSRRIMRDALPELLGAKEQREANTRLREALEKHGTHSPVCFLDMRETHTCTCGFTAALAHPRTVTTETSDDDTT